MTKQSSEAARALARQRWGDRPRMVDRALDTAEKAAVWTPDQVERLRHLAETLTTKEK